MFVHLCNLRPCQTHQCVRLSIRNPQRLKFGLPLGFIQEYHKILESKAVTQTIYTTSTTLAHFEIQSVSSHLSLTMHREDSSTRTTEYTCFQLWRVLPFQRITCIFTCWGRQLSVCSLRRPCGSQARSPGLHVCRAPSLRSHCDSTYFVNV